MEIILNKLIELWLYDIEVFSQTWLYAWLLVPAMFYLMFFMIKWTVLTTPLWLPIVIIINSFKRESEDKVIKKNGKIYDQRD
ncbi:MAG: hypothetical protein ACD_33C00034G0007 [uncultured bacterium]|nr:MAG: hypothetical protein ACD_33C00034G0007 [uncultured bacterium]